MDTSVQLPAMYIWLLSKQVLDATTEEICMLFTNPQAILVSSVRSGRYSLDLPVVDTSVSVPNYYGQYC